MCLACRGWFPPTRNACATGPLVAGLSIRRFVQRLVRLARLFVHVSSSLVGVG
eukprot:gene22074-20351_t